MDNKEVDFTQESVTWTQPRASSTMERVDGVKKKDVKKVPVTLTYSPNHTQDSFKLSLDSQSKLSIDENFVHNMSAKLQEQRKLAAELLKKRTNLGLPSPYLKHVMNFADDSSIPQISGTESTINESDLLKSGVDFQPSTISTPRESKTSEEEMNQSSHSVSFMSEVGSMRDSLADMYNKIKNPDFSIKELCQQFQQFHSKSNVGKNFDVSFIPTKLAKEQLMADELRWRQEHGDLGTKQPTNDSLFSSADAANLIDSKLSIGEFFRGKSEDLSKLCKSSSPERHAEPVALVDNSSFNDLSNQTDLSINRTSVAKESLGSFDFTNDSLSVSKIAKALSTDDTDTKIIHNLLQYYKEPKQKTKETAVKSMATTQQKNNSKEKENVIIRDTEDFDVEKLSAPQMKTNVLKESNNAEHNVTDIKDQVSDGKTTVTSRSSSSLSNLPEGRLPIESTRVDLIWGCVKIEKSSVREFVIRNKSQAKLRIQATVNGTSYKILKDHSESELVTSLPILLHSMETRSIKVMFKPTKIGAAIEKLVFSPMEQDLLLQQSQSQHIKLYGYGGHVSLDVPNVTKDTAGKSWLSLGCLNSRSGFKRDLVIRNKGTLTMFVYITTESRELYSFSNIVVNLNEFTVKPNEQMIVTVTFTPTKDDLKLFKHQIVKNDILDIGSLKITYGSEPLRGRIRQLYKKAKDKSLFSKDALIEKLSFTFMNEKMPQDLKYFKESVASMKTLLQELSQKEITLTLEHDPESTIMGHLEGSDDTSMFQSLCQDVTAINLLDATVQNSNMYCDVDPNYLVLVPPHKSKDSFLLISKNSSVMHFEIVTEPAGTLDVTPETGVLASNDTLLIRVSCTKIIKDTNVKIKVYVDNDVFVVNVKVLLINNK